jgi:hypothetical protein
MSGFLDWIMFILRFGADHLLSGLILSAAVFVGLVVVFLVLFREQRWSASNRYQASLFIFLALAATPFLTGLRMAPSIQASPPGERFTQGIDLIPPPAGMSLQSNFSYRSALCSSPQLRPLKGLT